MSFALQQNLNLFEVFRDRGFTCRLRLVTPAAVVPPVTPPAVVDPKLACLADHPRPSAAAVSAKATWRFTDALIDTQTVKTIRVSLCPNPSDPTCAAPLATKVPDDTGRVTFDLDLSKGPFSGYLAVDPVGVDGAPPDQSNTYYPARFFFESLPIYKDFTDKYQLFTYGTLKTFTQLYGIPTPNPNLGLVLVWLVDCRDAYLAGGSIDLDAKVSTTQPFYFLQGNTPTLTSGQTDASGNAAFLDVPTGARVVTARVASTGQTLGSLTLYSLPGTVSLGPIGPRFTR